MFVISVKMYDLKVNIQIIYLTSLISKWMSILVEIQQQLGRKVKFYHGANTKCRLVYPKLHLRYLR